MPRDGSFRIGRVGAFEVRQLGADGHFALVGELDMAAVDDLFAGLRDAIDRGGTITLDLRELTFVDVVGGHAIGVVGGMVAGRGSIVLEAPSRSVLKLLRLVGAEQFAGIHIAAPLSESA
jgi:anti-anti-sigma regulatory factor